MVSGPVGILVNPASGKDVRRLVARASVFDNQEKRAIVRRAVTGAIAAGAPSFRYMPDSHAIAETAVEDIEGIDAREVEAPQTASMLDTVRAARSLQAAGCACVITLGGDGTNRAFCKGWRDAVLMPISTGTNNVFPQLVEATVAGAAAGLVASGRVRIADVASRVKAVTVQVDGEADDLALIDAVVTRQPFIGARALLDASALALAVLTRANAAAVGITAVGGLLSPLADADDGALVLELGRSLTEGSDPSVTVHAPIAPGLYADVVVGRAHVAPLGEKIVVEGPCTLAFDGERERVLRPGQRAVFSVARDGPWVIDVERALAAAACRGLFRSGESNAD
jgi:hypothetical protein